MSDMANTYAGYGTSGGSCLTPLTVGYLPVSSEPMSTCLSYNY